MKKFILSITLLFSVSLSFSQSRKDKIENYLDEIGKAGFSGSVIIESDSIHLSKSYGYADRENKITCTENTIYDIGSLTKQFTATAILKLESQGKLSTNNKISDYFTSVPSDKAGISIHDLLRHQSGLKSNVGKDYDRCTEEEFLKSVMGSELMFTPGSSMSYSNIGYSLLAMIIEKVSGQSYESYLYENLWKPAGMEKTGYKRPQFKSSDIAVGYDAESRWGKPTEKEWSTDGPYWHLKGNGGILSTANDLLKWQKAMDANKILPAKFKLKLLHPSLRKNETNDGYYAYGWDVTTTIRKTTKVWHNGTNHIFYADYLNFPDEHTTMIMLTNKSNLNYNDLTHEIARFLFNSKYELIAPVPDTKANRNYTMEMVNLVKVSGLEKAEVIYKGRAKDTDIIEYLMSDEGFNLMENEPAKAVEVFHLNAIAHPASWRAYRDLGEGYMQLKNKEESLKYFEKSRSINPESRFVIDMIAKLKE